MKKDTKKSDSIQDTAILFATIEVTHIAVIRGEILHRKDLRFGAGVDAAGGFAALVVGKGEGQLVGEVMVAGHTLEVQLQGIFLRSVSVMWNLNGTMHQLQIHFSPETDTFF